VIMTILSSLFTFLPIFFQQHFTSVQLFESVEFYNGPTFDVTLIATFFAALPMTLDTLLDFRLSLQVTLPRFLIVISLALPGIMAYVAHNTLGTTVAVSFAFVGIVAREVLLRGALLSFLLYEGCSRRTVLAVSCVWIMVMFSLHTFLWRPYRPDVVTYSWNTCGRIMSIASVLFVSAILIHRWHKTLTASVEEKSQGMYATFYPALFTLNVVLKYILLLVTNDMTYSGFLDVIICILATTIPGRQARREKAIAEHIIASKREYMSYMSHEIRTPLNAVYMGIQLLAKECAGGLCNSSDLMSIVSDIDTSCKVAIDILNEFLLANKLEAGNVTLEKELVVVADLIGEVVIPFGVQARQKEVSYNYSGDSHIDPALRANNVHIYVDSMKFSQVIRNLISNALKFTPKGGRVDVYAYLTTTSQSTKLSHFSSESSVLPRVLFSNNEKIASEVPVNVPPTEICETGQSVLRIEVHDTGVGISSENQQKLFGQIVQFFAAQLQNGGGSGIGLWISKKIVDLHGGYIGVKSEPGKGSMFFVEIDVAADAALKSERRSDPDKIPRSQSSSQHIVEINSNDLRDLNVLIVDDSAVNRKMLTRLMESRVGQISQAENGVEATEKVRESVESDSPFDLIFMDASMPEMSGEDATVLIRSTGFQGMIVFLTGNVSAEDVTNFMSAGADDVIAKPCTLDSVEKILATVCKTICLALIVYFNFFL